MNSFPLRKTERICRLQIQSYSENIRIFFLFMSLLSGLRKETATSLRCYLNFFIYYLPTCLKIENLAELYVVVRRKFKVKKLEVPFFRISN